MKMEKSIIHVKSVEAEQGMSTSQIRETGITLHWNAAD